MISKARLLQLGHNKELFRIGQKTSSLYFLLSGARALTLACLCARAKASIPTYAGDILCLDCNGVQINVLKPGAIFGELAALRLHTERTMTTKARGMPAAQPCSSPPARLPTRSNARPLVGRLASRLPAHTHTYRHTCTHAHMLARTHRQKGAQACTHACLHAGTQKSRHVLHVCTCTNMYAHNCRSGYLVPA